MPKGVAKDLESKKRKLQKAMTGERNSMFGKRWFHSEESKIKIAEKSLGRVKSERERKSISEKLKGRHHSIETKKKIKENHAVVDGEKNSFFGKHHSDKTKNEIRNKKLGKALWNENHKNELRIWMKNGHAVFMNSFIRNPSKPQVELFRLAQQISPYPILNYPVYSKQNYSIDIAIPSLGIALEYDGSYYHQDEEYDCKRQEDLEDQGWKFIRYRDRVPFKEQLIEDINGVLT